MNFIKKALKFGSGVMLAQLITAASIPLLTRIYTPENFSKFGLYFSISLILVCFVTLKLEILLAKEKNINEDINRVVNVSYIMTIPILLVSFIVICFIEKSFNFYNILIAIFILVGTISFALFDTINIVNLRENNIGLANKARISRSVFSVIFQIIFSFLSKIGLFFGEVVGRFLGLLIISKKNYFVVNLKDGFYFLKNRFNYIKYVVCANFINSVGVNLFPIIIINFYDPILVGKYFFIHKVVGSPISLITQSISISLLGDFNKIIDQKNDLIISKIKKISSILFLLSTGLFVCIGVFFHFFEEMIFGSGWKNISILIFLLIPFLVGQCAFSPFSQLLVLLNGEKKQLIWDISRVIIVFCIVTIPNLIPNDFFDFYKVLFLYSVVGFLLYFIQYFMVLNSIKNFSCKVDGFTR